MDYIRLAGIILGSLLIIIYIIAFRNRGIQLQLSQAFTLFLAGNALAAGVKVIIFSFDSEFLILASSEGIDSYHIIAGGIAICWVSILTIFNIVRVPPKITPQPES